MRFSIQALVLRVCRFTPRIAPRSRSPPVLPTSRVAESARLFLKQFLALFELLLSLLFLLLSVELMASETPLVVKHDSRGLRGQDLPLLYDARLRLVALDGKTAFTLAAVDKLLKLAEANVTRQVGVYELKHKLKLVVSDLLGGKLRWAKRSTVSVF